MISRSECMILGTISLDPHPEIDKLKNLPGIKMYELNEDNRQRLTEVVASDILQLTSN
jgi:nucleoside-triphosphatase